MPLLAGAVQAQCISYGPDVVLTGKLDRLTFPGRPNYESITNGDEAETGFYVRLSHAVCTKGDPESEDEYPQQNVRLVQLVLKPSQYNDLRPFLGQQVRVRGELFASHTGHHHAPLLLQVKSHEQLSR